MRRKRKCQAVVQPPCRLDPIATAAAAQSLFRENDPKHRRRARTSQDRTPQSSFHQPKPRRVRPSDLHLCSAADTLQSPHLDSTVTSLRIVRCQIRKQSKVRREVDFLHASCTTGAPPLKLETLPITTTGPHHLLSPTSHMKRVHSYHISTERPLRSRVRLLHCPAGSHSESILFAEGSGRGPRHGTNTVPLPPPPPPRGVLNCRRSLPPDDAHSTRGLGFPRSGAATPSRPCYRYIAIMYLAMSTDLECLRRSTSYSPRAP